ncbi:MAG: 50S ribosomal protein P1 [Nanoarchaeota archaeon]|nr:50S ribosomal protein P1 [Nanoarchaeota archaeon]MBU4284205.1 50S ribosomal protein P1 [Nanoarchaeota archaeon]
MEYVYAAMLIHKAGGKIDEATVTKVLESAGAKPDSARVKALVAAFDGVDIEKVIKESSVMQVAAPAAGQAEEKKEEKPEAKKEEEKKSQEQAAAGLGSLFG